MDQWFSWAEILIEEFGGTKGIRDRNLLESSIYRPFSTFDGQGLYKTPVDKAAACGYLDLTEVDKNSVIVAFFW